MPHLCYNFASHHHKYMMHLAKETLSPMVGTKNPKAEIALRHRTYDIGITNSLYGGDTKPRTVEALFENSRHRKVLLMGHSMFGANEHVTGMHGDGEKTLGVIPGYFKWLLGHKIPEHCILYPGHYMGLYHLRNKYAFRPFEEDAVLFMPIAGIKSIDELFAATKNIVGKKIYVRVHPAVEDGFRFMHERDRGINLQGYLRFATQHGNAEVILPSQESLRTSMGACKYVMATPPSSTLIEAAIHAKIFHGEKRIVYTHDMEGIPSKFGVNVSDSPYIDDFSVIPRHILDEIVIDRKHQSNEINRAIKLLTWRNTNG